MDVVEAGISREELQLAARNHGMPLEALRYPITPAGLHYLLIHYDIPAIDETTWRLQVGGNVGSALELSLDDIRRRPRVCLPVTLECAGNGRALLEPRPISQPWLTEAVGTAEWAGSPLRGILEDAGLDDASVEVLFTGQDRGIEGEVEQEYERALPLEDAMREEVLLAYEMNGALLLPQHGAPLRLIVPGWYGMTHVKWLRRITILSEPFHGYQHARSYRMRSSNDDPGEPVTRMAPRSLIVPPGIPEFLTRKRFVDAGSHVLQGRAWSGRGEIVGVEVSSDGGETWGGALLEEPLSRFAWRGFTFAWEAVPGEHELCCRAADTSGATQPAEPGWNLGGYENNAVQRIPVVVR